MSIVLFYVLFVCKCVLYYCHRVSTQLQLTNISYHFIHHIISYHRICPDTADVFRNISAIRLRDLKELVCVLLIANINYQVHGEILWSTVCRRGPEQRSRYSDSLQAARSGDRIPIGARFSAAVQTGPGAHPTSYTMGIGSLSRE